MPGEGGILSKQRQQVTTEDPNVGEKQGQTEALESSLGHWAETGRKKARLEAESPGRGSARRKIIGSWKG